MYICWCLNAAAPPSPVSNYAVIQIVWIVASCGFSSAPSGHPVRAFDCPPQEEIEGVEGSDRVTRPQAPLSTTRLLGGILFSVLRSPWVLYSPRFQFLMIFFPYVSHLSWSRLLVRISIGLVAGLSSLCGGRVGKRGISVETSSELCECDSRGLHLSHYSCGRHPSAE